MIVIWSSCVTVFEVIQSSCVAVFEVTWSSCVTVFEVISGMGIWVTVFEVILQDVLVCRDEFYVNM